MAFQIADDLLDYTQSEAAVGKPTGQDLREHKVTLPLIAAMREMPAAATPRSRRSSPTRCPRMTGSEVTRWSASTVAWSMPVTAPTSSAPRAAEALLELPDGPGDRGAAAAIAVRDRARALGRTGSDGTCAHNAVR
jgi:octaprenyl-diphosphate synthase